MNDELERNRDLALRWAAQDAFEDGRVAQDIEVNVLDADEISTLLGWLHQRMVEYRKGAEYLPNPEDYDEWIGMDLGEPFESDGALTRRLCEAAADRFGGWPT